MSEKNSRAKRAKRIIDTLKKEYPGKRPYLNFDTPLNLLVATILSARCTDKSVNRLTFLLFKKYKTVTDYARAALKTLSRDIKAIGLYRTKARNIKKTAQKIVRDFNGEVPDTMERLILLPGVGRKTANIVLSYAFKKIEGIAVDTHVARLSKRLGLTAGGRSDKIEEDLMNTVPKRRWGDVNRLFITHGRAVCRARNPLHSACAIRRYCKLRRNDEEARMHNPSGKT